MPNIASLHAQIQRSQLLTKSDKKAWTKKTERMNDDQLRRLEDILTRAEGLDWNRELSVYHSAVASAENVIKNQDSSPSS